jgi:Tol biopolymer transport system component
MDADGTGVARLTNSPGLDGDASFTADGQSVVFHSQRTGHRQIFLQSITSSDAVQLTQEPADNSQPSMSPDGEMVAFVSNREGNNHIWLMAKDGSSQRALTRGPQTKESAPHFLRDGALAYLVEQKESGRTVTQVVKADLVTGKVAPLSAIDLVVADFAASPGGDLLGLVVAVQKNLFRVYVQPVGASGGGAPVPIPTTGAEQMVSPAFMP